MNRISTFFLDRPNLIAFLMLYLLFGFLLALFCFPSKLYDEKPTELCTEVLYPKTNGDLVKQVVLHQAYAMCKLQRKIVTFHNWMQEEL